MVKKPYIPDRGDIVWLNFDPQSGHEQKGKRPAFVLSPIIYNQKVGLALFCPVTSQIKGYPFEVKLRHLKEIEGVVLSDQIKSLDWQAREAEFIEKAPDSITNEVILLLNTILQ
ncbi:MAG: transcriptional modulator of MazE/toxin, MazF [Ignavibacteria bacterium]|nr:transcriptional modulator of MazE/toxin, MazF [Ignavibacteria bacterium]